MSLPTTPQQQQISMNSPSLNYNNLPPDHILNKQRSNISIKQINKNQQVTTTSTNNTNAASTSTAATITQQQQLNNNHSIIINSNTGQSSLVNQSNNNNSELTMPPPPPSSLSITSPTISIMNNNTVNIVNMVNSYNNNSNNNGSMNNVNNSNVTSELALTNRTQFLIDSSSVSTLSDAIFNIRIGNPKQIEMEITKIGPDIKYFNRACIHDLDSLQRYWSECYRIESEHMNDKPLMYIPITGFINIKLYKFPNTEHNLEKKYDFRQYTDSLVYPIKFDNNIVIVLKLLKMDYVEFIGLQAVDFYLTNNQSSTIQQ